MGDASVNDYKTRTGICTTKDDIRHNIDIMLTNTSVKLMND